MLVVALQFFAGDWWRAMKLARLLADLEQRRRDDVCLLFVRTMECPVTRILDETISRCSDSFHVESLVLRPDTPERRERWGLLGRWPVGANVLWQGAVDYFLRSLDSRWTSLFTVDGGDSVPTCREWLDVLLEDHAKTVEAGLGITGQVGMDGIGRWHVNLNQVVERSFFSARPEVVEMPAGAHLWEPIDMYRAGVFLPACRASTVIRSDWRYVGAKLSDFSVVSKSSAWWHGCKDGNIVDLAREHIVGYVRTRPAPLDLGRASDVVVASSC
jgi:hypothetical protein